VISLQINEIRRVVVASSGSSNFPPFRTFCLLNCCVTLYLEILLLLLFVCVLHVMYVFYQLGFQSYHHARFATFTDDF
jgi:hypothetical protein